MKRRVRGQVLVLFALALVVLLGFGALAVDVGYMYTVRHELQRCADSGALAGASKFAEPDSGWSPNESDPVMIEAAARARGFASSDLVATSQLDPAVEVAVSFPSQDRIRVTTSRTVNLFFARVLGRDNQAITATAVAEAAVADAGVRCLKPWGIPLPWDDFGGDGAPATDNNSKYDSGEHVYDLEALSPGFKMVLKVGEPGNNPNNLVEVPSLQQESGHFFALSPCGDSGASDYRDRIASQCLDDCTIDEGDGVDLKTGNMVGPTKQGVNDLIGLDEGAVFSVSADGEITVEGSSAEGGWLNSPRLVKVPIYDPNELLHQGNTQMHVIAFAGFWLEGYETQQGTVTGYYVPSAVLGGSSSAGPSPGPVLKTLRLVE